MKLYAFVGGETDWVAAPSEQEAREAIKAEYGIDDVDLDCTEVSLVENTDAVTVYLDETNVETEEQETKTATEVMAGMTRPGLVCSTAYM